MLNKSEFNLKKVKLNSIYSQLLLNIVLPVLLGLIIIGTFSYQNTKSIQNHNNETEQIFIYDEIKSFIELQFVALSIIEEPMEKQMEQYSNKLVNEHFANTHNIENIDLNRIMKKLNMNSESFDLYIINEDGIVINTTFKEDLYINFFSFGLSHKNYLLKIFSEGTFDSPRFFFEHKTKRYKKYTYHSTLDKKYIIEIGLYSEQADKIYDYTISHLMNIPFKKPNLLAVDMFFLGDKPYPLILSDEFIPEHINIISHLKQGKTVTLPFNAKGKMINYSYFYLKSENPKIFDGIIVRIANDPTKQNEFIVTERLKIFTVLILSLILTFLLIYFRAKSIVKPIQYLIDKSKIIAGGNYNERVKIKSNKEITELADNFNNMVNNIQERNLQIEEQSEFLYKSNRNLNQAYKLLDHQKNIIENKKDDLTASISYAHRIQESLLPSLDEFSKIFPESFVHMLPRDIVSGDFYWFSHINNKIIIVVSDCTGHGVPGAFMSMIGMTILNFIVNHEKVYDPALILSRLDTEICDLFIYRNRSEQRFEGMDAAVCCFDMKEHKMTFSSAQRPIIFVRNGEAKTYKSSIYPIGEYYDDVQKIFTNTIIDLYEGDLIYMFSDGYTSQFDENDDKKFNYTRFRKLLTDINHRPVKEHPAIIHRTFEAWKGNNDQIDDILIVGIKYIPQKPKKKISAKDIIGDE